MGPGELKGIDGAKAADLVNIIPMTMKILDSLAKVHRRDDSIVFIVYVLVLVYVLKLNVTVMSISKIFWYCFSSFTRVYNANSRVFIGAKMQ